MARIPFQSQPLSWIYSIVWNRLCFEFWLWSQTLNRRAIQSSVPRTTEIVGFQVWTILVGRGTWVTHKGLILSLATPLSIQNTDYFASIVIASFCIFLIHFQPLYPCDTMNCPKSTAKVFPFPLLQLAFYCVSVKRWIPKWILPNISWEL